MSSPDTIPDIVKHMTLAIMGRVPQKGSEEEHFLECLKAARGRLTKWGYLMAGSDQGPATSMRLTMKGILRNAHHAKENAGKNDRFDQLYAKIQEQGKDKDADGYNPDKPVEDRLHREKKTKKPIGHDPKKPHLKALQPKPAPSTGRSAAKTAPKTARIPKAVKTLVSKIKKAVKAKRR